MDQRDSLVVKVLALGLESHMVGRAFVLHIANLGSITVPHIWIPGTTWFPKQPLSTITVAPNQHSLHHHHQNKDSATVRLCTF